MQIPEVDGPHNSSRSIPPMSPKTAGPLHQGSPIPIDVICPSSTPDEDEMMIDVQNDTDHTRTSSDSQIESGITSTDKGVSKTATSVTSAQETLLGQSLPEQSSDMSDSDVEMTEGAFDADLALHNDMHIQFGKTIII